MSESAEEIRKLLYLYAECVDLADFGGIGELFAHGRIRASPDDARGREGASEVEGLYRAANRVHENGTLCTRHVTTNAILDIEERPGRAKCRSYFLVLQATAKLPLQPIVAGRYHDQFERIAGVWRFSDRLIFVDQVGDLSDHLLFDLPKG